MTERAADALTKEGVLLACFGAIVDDMRGDEFVNYVDRDAGLKVLADTVMAVRQAWSKQKK